SGGLSIAGNGGLGLSVGYASITETLSAYVEGSSLTIGGDVDVVATSNTELGSLGLALGFAIGGTPLGGGALNVSINQVSLTLEAFIGAASDTASDTASDGSSTVPSDIVSAGGISIEATDTSYLASVSGGLAVAPSGSAAVGAAASYNVISN